MLIYTFIYYKHTMNVTVIHASPNLPSNSTLLGEHFIQGVQTLVPQANITILNVYTLDLPNFTVDKYSKEYTPNEAEQQLEACIRNSDAIVITTPVWNFGVPAPLKNLTDHLGRFCLSANPKDKMPGTPLYILFTGGGPKVAWYGMLKKTTLFLPEGWRYMGATPVGSLFIGGCTKGPGQFGLVLDKRIDDLMNAQQQGSRFAAIVQRYLHDGTLPAASKRYSQALQVGQKIMTALFSR